MRLCHQLGIIIFQWVFNFNFCTIFQSTLKWDYWNENSIILCICPSCSIIKSYKFLLTLYLSLKHVQDIKQFPSNYQQHTSCNTNTQTINFFHRFFQTCKTLIKITQDPSSKVVKENRNLWIFQMQFC